MAQPRSQGKTSPLIFASCRACPSYLASAETVCDLLLPAQTTGHEKWLPAETVCVILLPAEMLSRKLNHTVSAGSYFPSRSVSAGSKRSLTVSTEAKYDGQSLQGAKISGLVYTLCRQSTAKKTKSQTSMYQNVNNLGNTINYFLYFSLCLSCHMLNPRSLVG